MIFGGTIEIPCTSSLECYYMAKNSHKVNTVLMMKAPHLVTWVTVIMSGLSLWSTGNDKFCCYKIQVNGNLINTN